MNIVDSSGWLEYFSFPLNDTSSLIVPGITIYEVFKVVLRESNENEALQAIAAMEKGLVKDLSTTIAMYAAKISLRHNLPMANSFIFAMTNIYKCTLWTQDSDFENLPNVKFIPKSVPRS